MGMWQGIYQGMRDVEARKQSEADRELARRRIELAEKEFDENSRLAQLKLITSIKDKFTNVKTTKKTGGTSDENATRYTNVLKTRFKVDPETITKLYTNGGVDALKSAVDIAVKYDDQFKTGQFTGGSPETVIGEMLNTAIITAPEIKTIDWASIEADLGIQVDEATRELVGSEFTVPGAVDYVSPTLIEKPSLTELDQADKRGISNAESLARGEIVRINNRVNQITAMKEDGSFNNLSEKERAIINAEFAWLTDRGPDIESALEAYKNDSFIPLIELYGSEFISTIKEFYPNLENAPLNPAFNYAAQKEISVPNRDVAIELKGAGILRPGMTVRNLKTGKLIPIGG